MRALCIVGIILHTRSQPTYRLTEGSNVKIREINLGNISPEQQSFVSALLQLPAPSRYEKGENGEVKKVSNPQFIEFDRKSNTLKIRENRYGRIRRLLRGGGIEIPYIPAGSF